MYELYDKEEPYLLTTFDMLKEKSIELLKKDNFTLALHILNAIYDSSIESNWYAYDFTAGTTYTPHCLIDADDVEKYIGFMEED